jgi:Flp pilus assembly protein TadD
VKSRNSQPYPYTSLARTPIRHANPGYRALLKFTPLLLVLIIGVSLGLSRGPGGVVDRVISARGGANKEILYDAYQLIVDGDFTAAAVMAADVTRSDPDNALAFHILGLADARRGFTEEAAISFEQATVLDPDFVEAWYDWGFVEENRGEFARALLAYRSASELAPGNSRYSDSVGRMRKALTGEGQWEWRESEAGNMMLEGIDAMTRGNPEDLDYAENIFRALVDARPYDVTAANLLGMTLAKKGNVEEAEKVLQEAVHAEPGFADAWFNLGMVHRAMGRLDDALNEFRTAESATTLDSLKMSANVQALEIAQILQNDASGAGEVASQTASE